MTERRGQVEEGPSSKGPACRPTPPWISVLKTSSFLQINRFFFRIFISSCVLCWILTFLSERSVQATAGQASAWLQEAGAHSAGVPASAQAWPGQPRFFAPTGCTCWRWCAHPPRSDEQIHAPVILSRWGTLLLSHVGFTELVHHADH